MTNTFIFACHIIAIFLIIYFVLSRFLIFIIICITRKWLFIILKSTFIYIIIRTNHIKGYYHFILRRTNIWILMLFFNQIIHCILRLSGTPKCSNTIKCDIPISKRAKFQFIIWLGYYFDSWIKYSHYFRFLNRFDVAKF